MKQIISLLLILITLVFSAISTIYAATEYDIDILGGCNNIYYDSNRQGAFACGFSGNTVYSVKVMPEYVSRYVTVDGSIKSMSQSGKYTYALICKDVITNSYDLLELNMDNGNCKYYKIKNERDIVTKYFSVSDGYVFFINTDDLFSYVKCINLVNGKVNTYRFDINVNRLFNNNGKTYAVLYDGSVFNLTSTYKSFCTVINSDSKISNAGVDKIYTNDGIIISLTDGKRSNTGNADKDCVSVSGNKTYYAVHSTAYCLLKGNSRSCSLSAKAKAILSYSDWSAIITADGKCTVLSENEYKSYSFSDNKNNSNDNFIKSKHIINSDGILCSVESGTKVSDFKRNFLSSVNVCDSKGNIVTSGKMKTGYKVKYNGNDYLVAVKGDVTGEGNVKSNDVTKLMDYFVNRLDFSAVFKAAADYNLDGNVDNKDLVLISRCFAVQ